MLATFSPFKIYLPRLARSNKPIIFSKVVLPQPDGPKKVITALNGQCLHAKTLGFIHPVTGEYMEFTAPLPEYFTEFERKLVEL